MADCNEAVILAGGLGTRLRGVVDDVPKPLAPVAGRPFLAWVLDRLATQHIERVVLAIGYLGEQVEAVLGGEWNGMVLEYSREAAPLGTGGAIVLAGERVRGNDFFVVNGDTWLDLNYLEFDRCVASANARLGIALAKVPNVERYGAVRVEGGRVTGFIEKGTVGPGLINAGVYRVRRSLLDDCPRSTMFSFEQEVLVPAASNELVMGYTITEGFIDIGVPEDYRRAQTLLGPEPRG